MTVDELLQAIRDAQPTEGGEGVTITEMARAANRTDESIRKLVRPLLEAGTLRATRKRITGMDGRVVMVPSYAMVETPKAKAKRGRA